MAMPTDENTKSRQFYEKLKNQYGMKGGWTVPTVMGLNQTLVALRAVEAAAKKSGAANVTGRGVREALLSTTITSEQRSDEHTSELQSLMRISYAVFCLKKKKKTKKNRRQ